MLIEIEPFDTLFFRDGKPFTMGSETWADGIFPPPPSVFYGALRTAYFSEHPEELKTFLLEENNDNDPTKNLEIKGIYYRYKGEVHLPLPLDLVHPKNKEKKEYTLNLLKLQEIENSYFTSLNKKINLLEADKEVEAFEDGLLFIDKLRRYLRLIEIDKLKAKRFKDIITSEPKIGIGRNNNTRTTEEGNLYRVPFNRLDKNFKFIIDFESLSISEKGFLKLGGEGKVANYKIYNENKKIEIKSPSINTKFKLYLSTPAIFKNGWLPSWIDENTLEGTFEGVKIKLLTACIGKPILIGGFDMKEKKPKPMKKCVPAGSVYYFESSNNDISKIIEKFHGKAISDYDEFSKQGFGISYIGDIK